MTLQISEGHSGNRGGAQFAAIIKESGLYRLILTTIITRKQTGRPIAEPPCFTLPAHSALQEYRARYRALRWPPPRPTRQQRKAADNVSRVAHKHFRLVPSISDIRFAPIPVA